VGFYSPVQGWNPGKAAEFRDRVEVKPELKGETNERKTK
jgi:hypothetical protein